MFEDPTGPWPQGEPARMWELAISPDQVARKQALVYWAEHRNTLPGSIFFTLSEHQLSTVRSGLTGQWRRVLEAADTCACGKRGTLVPATNTPYYTPPSPERYTLGPGKPHISLGPWGGDAQSIDLQLSAVDGQIIHRIMPFTGLTREQLANRGGGTYKKPKIKVGGTPTTPAADGEATWDLEGIANTIDETGAPLPIPVLISTEGGHIASYPYAVMAVHVESSTVVIAVNRNTSVIDATNRSFHRCA